MLIYTGNESEKPAIRDLIVKLKSTNNIKGKTVTVADKGLNCAKNINEAIKQGDGYIFSKSVKQLPQKELAWIFNSNNGWIDVSAPDGNILYSFLECIDDYVYNLLDERRKITLREKRIATFNPSLQKKQLKEINRMMEKAKKAEFGESGKYVNFKTTGKDKIGIELNHEKINKDKQLAGYNILVTSELNMSATEVYEAYHQLWRIEESFKIMKSELDGRPVFVRDKNTIIAHFLVCYLCVLLERLLEFIILDNNFNDKEISNMTKTLDVVKEKPGKYINISEKSKLIFHLARTFKIPIDNYYIEQSVNHKGKCLDFR